MSEIKDLFKSADWKQEKHVPVIDIVQAKKGEAVKITVAVGKEIAHPNTTEHHISWIEVYFQPEGGKAPYQIGQFSFTSHGASADGPNTSTVYTEPCVDVTFKTEKPGKLLASSYCNIHGLWQGSADLNLG